MVPPPKADVRSMRSIQSRRADICILEFQRKQLQEKGLVLNMSSSLLLALQRLDSLHDVKVRTLRSPFKEAPTLPPGQFHPATTKVGTALPFPPLTITSCSLLPMRWH